LTSLARRSSIPARRAGPRPRASRRAVCASLPFAFNRLLAFREFIVGATPISALLTSASVHDVNVAIPLMTMTAARVDYCYDVMDSAYHAQAVLDHICAAGRVPVVMPHPRRGTKKPLAVPKVFPAKPTPELCPAKRERFQERTGGERVNGRL
jgi:hypothetical protein